jgi:hypothetical protein
VFLSSVTADLVEHDLPAGVKLVDLGLHRLKGIALPQTIKAVKADGLSTVADDPRLLLVVDQFEVDRDGLLHPLVRPADHQVSRCVGEHA